MGNTVFKMFIISLCEKRGFSRYRYTDAANGRFNSPFRCRYVTHKNGTTFSTCGINTCDVSSYGHYRSWTLLRGIIFTRLAVAAAATGEGSDLSIRFHHSFSEDTVWAVYWADYFGHLDLFLSGLRTGGKALGKEALRTDGKIQTDIPDNPQTGIEEIISKHVQSIVQNLGTKMTGRGRKRKRLSTSRK